MHEENNIGAVDGSDVLTLEAMAPNQPELDRQRRQAAWVAKARASRRELTIPAVVNPERKALALESAKAFMLTYCPGDYPVAFGQAHLEAIAGFEQVTLHGNTLTVCLPRGSGKTTMAKGLTKWYLLKYPGVFLVILAPSKVEAEAVLADIKSDLECNPLLMEDFPEVCVPIRALAGFSIRGRSLTVGGEPIRAVWKNDSITLPCVAGSPASGNSAVAIGMDGGIRGKNIRHPATGLPTRPALVYIEELVKREEANSKKINDERVALLKADVMNLGGHDTKPVAVYVNCTIIAAGDAADQITDNEQSPEWHPVKFPAIIRWPLALDTLWKEYGELRREGDRVKDMTYAEATAFYLANREAMRAGAEVYWETHGPQEIDGLQHWMNLYFRIGHAAFMAEFQLAPVKRENRVLEITRENVLERVNGVKRMTLPAQQCAAVVATVDVNRYGLTWTLVGADVRMSQAVALYGVHAPNGKAVYDPVNAMEAEELAIYRALCDLVTHLTGLVVLDQLGRARRIDCIGIDCGYKTKTVLQFCRAFPSRIPLAPMRGRASSRYRDTAKSVLRRGDGWMLCEWSDATKVIVFDADASAEDVQSAFLLPAGAPGSVSLNGDPRDKLEHTEFANQIVSQRLVEKTPGDSGAWYKWGQNGKNDFLDCLCMARNLAKYFGCTSLAELRAGAVSGTAAAPTPAAVIPKAPPPRRMVSIDRNW